MEKRQPPWPAADVVQLPAEAGFADWESWAWARILRGATADLSRYPGPLADDDVAAWLEGHPDEAGDDPAEVDDWPAHRRISARFLTLILFHEPFRSAPERAGVSLRLAQLPEALDWSQRETRAPLTFDRCRFEGPLVWYAGRVRGDLTLRGCVLDADMSAVRLRVEGSLSALDGLQAGGLSLNAAHVGMLALDGAALAGPLDGHGVRVDGDCFLRGARLANDAKLVGARIGGDLQLRQSHFGGTVDLTGARIGGELHLAKSPERPGPSWGTGSRLVLRQASCDAIAGGAEAFARPPEGTRSRPRLDFVPMDLVGLTYARFAGVGYEPRSTLARADARTLCRWLEAGLDPDGFSREPWRQLACALDRAGYPDKARFVRYEMHRSELRATATLSRRAWLWLADVLIGYGYRNGRALVWFVLLAAVVAVTGAWLSGPPLEPSSEGGALLARWFWFALDNGIPFVELDVAHQTFLADHSPAYTQPSIGIASLFYAHALVGLVVLTYLAAGLSGLATGEPRRIGVTRRGT